MSEADTEYVEAREDLRAVVSLAARLLDAAGGRTVTEWHFEYASYVFGKVLLHAISATKLAPTGLIPERPGSSELWDLSSVCAIVRALVDGYYALYFVAAEPVSAEERSFREALWSFQGEHKRLELLRLIQSQSPELVKLEAEVGRLKDSVVAHPFHAKLATKNQKAICKGDQPVYLTNSELSKRAGVSVSYYRAVYRYLSSYLHTYPFSSSQLVRFRAGDPESLHPFTVTLRYCLAFLSLAVRDFRSVFPDLSAVSEPAADEIIDQWVDVASQTAK